MTYLYNRRPYFYILEDRVTNKYYVGSKFGKDANPDIFMKVDGYLTSSPLIHSIIEEYGIERFIIRKLKEMEDPYGYETKFLSKVNARLNKRFINTHNNDGLLSLGTEKFEEIMLIKYGVKNPMYLDSIKEKNIESRMKVMNDPIWKETKGIERSKKLSETMNDPIWKETVGLKKSKKQSLTKSTAEWKETVGKIQKEKIKQNTDFEALGKKISDIRNSAEWKMKQHKICPYCGKGPMDPGNYGRYHGNNCKHMGLEAD